MKLFLYSAFLCSIVILSGTEASAQKGVDNQTQKIREESRTNPRSSDATRSFDWGEGKTPTREPLPNPYRMASRRDMLMDNIRLAIEERKLVIDEASSRPLEGIIVTQPFVFGRGPLVAQSELKRYARLEFGDNAWSRGQYTLTIEVQSIDGIHNNVFVNAKIEGRGGSGLTTEWITLQSSGVAEEEFLVKLVELVTGVSPNPITVIDN